MKIQDDGHQADGGAQGEGKEGRRIPVTAENPRGLITKK